MAKKRSKKTKEVKARKVDHGYYSQPAGPTAPKKLRKYNQEKYNEGMALAKEHLDAAKAQGVKHPRVLVQEKLVVQGLGHKDIVAGYQAYLRSKRKRRG